MVRKDGPPCGGDRGLIHSSPVWQLPPCLGWVPQQKMPCRRNAGQPSKRACACVRVCI
jgi:hypothetical protein